METKCHFGHQVHVIIIIKDHFLCNFGSRLSVVNSRHKNETHRDFRQTVFLLVHPLLGQRLGNENFAEFVHGTLDAAVASNFAEDYSLCVLERMNLPFIRYVANRLDYGEAPRSETGVVLKL